MAFWSTWFGRGSTAEAPGIDLLTELRLEEMKLRRKIIETTDDLFDRLVDPEEEFDGWLKLIADDASAGATSPVELQEMRSVTRSQATGNGYGRNFYRNIQNYVCGNKGFSYRFEVPRRPIGGMTPESFEPLIGLVEEVWESFYKANGWRAREREMVKVTHRDGEHFMRFFTGENGDVRCRKVDASAVKPDPQNEWEWGIVTDPVDKQTAVAYLVDDETVPADQMVHTKINVDSDVLRGMPTLWCVREQLHRAYKLLRNMSKLAEIQAAIAIVREHEGNITRTGLDALLTAQRQGTKTDPVTKTTINKQRIPEGAIVDLTPGTKLHFPVAGNSLAAFDVALQALLRCVASSVNFPEYMLTADASNANYSSTLVAASAAVKEFEAWQGFFGEVLQGVVERVIYHNVEVGVLPEEAMYLRVIVEGPVVESRDAQKQATARATDINSGVLSVQTACAERGLDYEQEQDNRDAHTERTADRMGPLMGPAQADRTADDDEDDEDDEDDGDGDQGDDANAPASTGASA